MPEPKAANVVEHSADEWEVVAQESGTKIDFDGPGAQFIGTYLGVRHIVPPNSTDPNDEFDQLQFNDAEGQIRTINAGYKLLEAFASIDAGKKVRITRTEDVQMNDPGKNDMKDYRVEVAR